MALAQLLLTDWSHNDASKVQHEDRSWFEVRVGSTSSFEMFQTLVSWVKMPILRLSTHHALQMTLMQVVPVVVHSSSLLAVSGCLFDLISSGLVCATELLFRLRVLIFGLDHFQGA